MPKILEDAGSPSSDTPPSLGLPAETAVGVLERPSAKHPVLGLAAEASIESFIHDSLAQAANALSVERLATLSTLPDHLVRPLKRMLRELKAPELFEPCTCELLVVISSIIDRKTPARARLDNLVEDRLKQIGGEYELRADVAWFDDYVARLFSTSSAQMSRTNQVANELAHLLRKLRQGSIHPDRTEIKRAISLMAELLKLWKRRSQRGQAANHFGQAVTALQRWHNLMLDWMQIEPPASIVSDLPWQRTCLRDLLNRIDRAEAPFEPAHLERMLKELEPFMALAIPVD